MEPIAITPKPSTAKKEPKKAAPKRKDLMAVTIIAGIITLIDENGNICYYRQRGITNIEPQLKLYLVNAGFLHRNWNSFKELPSGISIHYEDEELLGKARATFPVKEARRLLNI